MDVTEALRQQRHRCMFLRERLQKLGDQHYDADAALIVRQNPFFPRFNGHSVGQQSLEYALLLLHSDDRTYGTDDAGVANRILRKILDYQNLDPSSETYGNFYWMTHWDRVKDQNAVSFLTSGLIYAYLNFPDKLQDKTKTALEKAFPDLLAGIRSHKVRWQYTNIFFLNLGGLISLFRVLDDPSIHQEAENDFQMWLEGTADDGFHEFNSPTYTPVTLYGLEFAWTNTPDKAFRTQLERTMDLFNYQLALNLTPTGFLGGAPARAYQNDALYGTGWTAFHAHIKFGTPCPVLNADTDSTMFANLTLSDYVPPKPIRTLATDKAGATEIQERTVSLGSRRTHLMTPHYSLASQSMERVGGHSPPSYVLLVRNAPDLRKSVPFLPDDTFMHQPGATFQSRQIGNRIVGKLQYKLEERQRFLDDPTYICRPSVLFGLKESIREVRVGNVDWAGGDVQLLPGQSVAVSYGDLYLGVTTLPLSETGEPAPNRLLLTYTEDGELRLRITIHGGPDLCPENNPVDVLTFIETRISGESDTLADFARDLAAWHLSTTETSF
ncbi:MAG: hypothetical protein O7G87_22970, partial [bacterium]|nr:hypothetical protein [bacterium]